MSLRPLLLATLAAAAVVPAVALAGFPGSFNNEYEAAVERDQSAKLGFDVERVNGQKVASRFDVANVHYSCADATTERVLIPFPDEVLAVQDNRFAGKVKTIDSPPHVLRVEGVIRSADEARGRMSLRRRDDPGVPANNCYSGVLRWNDPDD
jgi:hypothetical protein